MDYNTLLDMATELGHRLAMAGAETFRVEDSINRVLLSYGIQAEAFSIPNCLIVSIETADGKPMTRMRRIGYHGNDLDAVEKYSNLSRRICSATPSPEQAMEWIRETDAARRYYNLAWYLIGNMLGACGFSVLFGGSLIDSLLAGVCGLVIGLINKFMDQLKVNTFFRTIITAFVMAVIAYGFGAANLSNNTDSVIIGALMILVPGLIFTNAMRDIIYGDTNSGINRIVQVFLIAAAIALGTGAAWKLAGSIWDIPESAPGIIHPLWIESIACIVGCIGFSILFNIHGPGGLLCALGGVLTWATYRIALYFGAGDVTAYFFATLTASIYAEIMARIRKYPAISYLVVSIFPLIPGAGIYYTMNHAFRGNPSGFTDTGAHTIAIAGVMAVGILLASTAVRSWFTWKNRSRIN